MHKISSPAEILRAPFPWFGGKALAAELIWSRLGDVQNYVEPFFGSGAVLLNAPKSELTSCINDLDGHVCNFWRAIKADSDAVAVAANYVVNEIDLQSRHQYLVDHRGELTEQLKSDPEFYDAKLAGWWAWGCSCWIGGGWCEDTNKAAQKAEKKAVQKGLPHLGNKGRGVNRGLPELGTKGRGVLRGLPHLGDRGKGVNRQMPFLSGRGQGVNRKLPLLSGRGQGVNRQVPELEGRDAFLSEWFDRLSVKLDRARVTCGDWERICSPRTMTRLGACGVLLDPPYGTTDDVYAEDSKTVAAEVRANAHVS